MAWRRFKNRLVFPERPTAFAVFLLALVVTAWAWINVKSANDERAKALFEQRIDDIASAIRQRMAAYEQILRGGAALFAASQSVEREEWGTYIGRLRIEQDYPGILGIGFSARILPADKAAHIARIRAEGYPRYALHPEGERDEYTAVVYIEPFSGMNLKTLGYDMFSEALRRAAMEQARDTGKPSLSGKVALVMDEGSQAGIFMYVPVYRNGAAADSVSSRRASLEGYVYAPFRVSDLMLGILGPDMSDVDVQIFDGTEDVDKKNILYWSDSSRQGAVGGGPSPGDSRSIDLYGRTWTLHVTPLQTFDAAVDTQKANIVMAGGLVTALLLYLVVNGQATLLSRARQLAHDMTKASQESERQTRAIIATASDAFVATDENGAITEWNARAESIFGWSAAEVIGSSLAEKIMPPTQREAHRSGLARYLNTSEGPLLDRRIELIALRRDGTAFPVELTIWATESSGRHRFNAFVTDVSQRKRAEAELKSAHERLNLALRASNLALFEWNVATGQVYLSEEWSHIMGTKSSPTRTTFDALEDLVHPGDKPLMRERIVAVLKGTTAYYEAEHRVRTSAHEWKWIHSIGKIVEHDSGGRALRMIGTNEDISDRKRTERELLEAHEQLLSSMQELEQRNRESERLSELGNVLQSCSALAEAFEPIAKTGVQLFPEDDGVLYFAGAQGHVEAAAYWGNPVVLAKSRGPVDCWSLRRGRLHRVDEPSTGHLCGHVNPETAKPYLCIPLVAQNNILGFIHISRRDASSPFSERSVKLAGSLAEQVSLALSNLRLRETLRHESNHDPLTGLYNRRYLHNAVHYELSRAKRKKDGMLAVVMLDIDHFKKYNDRFGHAAGDVALQAVGALLRSKSRDYDVPCRYGGEEFVIILPDISSEGAIRWADKFRQSVADFDLKHEGRAIDRITVSLGVATYPEHGNHEKDLLKAVDQALYAAKANGRNQVVLHSPTIARFGDPAARGFSDG